MKKLLIVLGSFILVFVASALWATSIYNTAIRYESTIEKTNKGSQDVLSAHINIIKEQAQIPDKYIEGLKEIYTATMNGRYGENGSNAIFQWIQEQNPQVDSNIYIIIQQQIAAGRKEFSLIQRQKIDVCGDYRVFYNSAVSGTVAKFFNFPKNETIKMCDIIVNADVIQEFNTGISNPIKLW